MGVRIRRFVGWLDGLPTRIADWFYELAGGGGEARRSGGREREGFALYSVFLAVEVVLGGGARWLIARGTIVWVELIVPLGSWVLLLPWIAALWRPLWSVAALAHLGGHGDEYRKLDVVHGPDDEEQQQLFLAMTELWTYDINVSMPERVLIADYWRSTGMVSRDTLILTTAP